MPLLRSIVHMDLDTFFVSCERLLDSRLNHKPILIGGTSDRGVAQVTSRDRLDTQGCRISKMK